MDVLLDAQLRDIGFKLNIDLGGSGIITQACTRYHNSKLDQNITHARFNIDLSMMSDLRGGLLIADARDAEIDDANSHLSLRSTGLRKMLPEIFKTLDQAEIDLAIQYLRTKIARTLNSCNK